MSCVALSGGDVAPALLAPVSLLGARPRDRVEIAHGFTPSRVVRASRRATKRSIICAAAVAGDAPISDAMATRSDAARFASATSARSSALWLGGVGAVDHLRAQQNAA